MINLKQICGKKLLEYRNANAYFTHLVVPKNVVRPLISCSGGQGRYKFRGPVSRVCVSQCRFWQSQYSTSFSLRKFVQKWLSNSICIELNLYSTRTQGQVCRVDHSIMTNYIECCRVSSIKSKTSNFRVHAVSTALNRLKLTDPSIVDPPDSRKPISPPHLRKLGGLRGVRIPSTVDLSQVLLIHYTSEVGSGTNRP